MESNNQVSITGFHYLLSYSGGLNILEVLLNVTIVIFMNLSGLSMTANIFCAVAVLAAVHTSIFIILHIRGVIRRSKLPWHWIECVSVLTVAILLAILSSIVLSALTRGYIITGIMGYVTSMVYFFDTFDKYQIAIMPVPKYAWTTPNMPDLS